LTVFICWKLTPASTAEKSICPKTKQGQKSPFGELVPLLKREGKGGGLLTFSARAVLLHLPNFYTFTFFRFPTSDFGRLPATRAEDAAAQAVS